MREVTSVPISYHNHFVISVSVYPYGRYLAINVQFYNNKIAENTPNIEIWFPIVGHLEYFDSQNRGGIIGSVYYFSSPSITTQYFQGLLTPGNSLNVVLLTKVPLEHAEIMKYIAEKDGIVQLVIRLQFSALYGQRTLGQKTINYAPIFRLNIPKKTIEAWVAQWSSLYAKYVELPVSVPGNVLHDYIEAIKAYDVGAYRAAVAMARRALQQALIDKGASKKARLVDQINELFEKGVLDKAIKSFANGIRHFGNYGAHPQEDGLDEIDKDTAQSVILFLKQVLIKLYEREQKLDELP